MRSNTQQHVTFKTNIRYSLHYTLDLLTLECKEVGTLAADGWAVTFGTARMGLGEAAACPGPSSLYQI